MSEAAPMDWRGRFFEDFERHAAGAPFGRPLVNPAVEEPWTVS
jgi:hypothetical protein